MASGAWTSVLTSGVWNLATNWSGSIIADGSSNTASFTSNITATTTIDTTIGGGWSGTIGNIVFSDSGASGSAWTLGSQSTITLAGGTPTITTTTGATISGVLAGTAGLIKAGAQTLTLAGANTFSGSITVNAGTLSVTTSASALGADTARALTVGSGNALSLGVATTRSSFSTFIAGTGVSSSGAIVIANTGTNNLGTITLTDAATIRSTLTSGTLSSSTIDTTASNYALTLTYGSGSAGTFTVSSLISGGGALSVTGGSVGSTNIALTNTGSTFTGQVSINGVAVLPSRIANTGAVSSFGTGSVTPTIKLGSGGSFGSLSYVGTTAATTDRAIDLASTTGTLFLAISGGANSLRFTAPTFVNSGVGAKEIQLFTSGSALSGASLVIDSIIPESAGGTTRILATGGGLEVLNGLNTYTGTTSAIAGTLAFNSIKSVSGGASAFGAPTTIANGTISLGSTSTTAAIRYTGSGDTTDRVIYLAGNTTGGATIENNGTGPLVFTSAITGVSATGTRTLTLSGSNAGVNNFQGIIADVGAGAGLTAFTKSGIGYWRLSGVNTFSGLVGAVGVSVTGGQLEIPALTALGSGTKTISISNTNRNGSMLLSGASVTYPSTLSWSLNSYGQNQQNSPLGAIRALADSTIAGTVTLATPLAGVHADTGDLTLNGLISGAFTFLARASTGKTVTIGATGGMSTITSFNSIGPGTIVWNGSATNTMTQPANINGGTLRMVTTTSTASLPLQFAIMQVNIGGNPTQTGSLSSRYQYTGGTLELSNSGAAGAVDYTGLTSTSAINLSRGSGKLKLSRDSTAGSFTVRLGNNTSNTPGSGVLTLEYAGTTGIIGTDSSIIFSALGPNAAYARIIISDGAGSFVPAYFDASRVAVPMVYGSAQSNVAASQAGGTTLTLLSTAFGNYNLTGDITAQATASTSTLRLATSVGTPITLAAGAILQSAFLMDTGTGTARTIVAGASGAKLSRSTATNASNVLGIWTENVTSTGATISADVDARYNAAFTKAGVGILSFTGAVANLSGINIAEGTFRIGSAGTFDSTFGAITLGNVYAASGTTVAAEFNQPGDVVVAGLSGGGANTAVTLSASTGDLVLRSTGSAGSTFGGNISLSGSQKLKIRNLSVIPEASSSLQAFQGSFPFSAIEMTRGNLSIDPQYGATITGTPSITASGGSSVTLQAANPLEADYAITLGAISVTNGALAVQFSAATPVTNPYAARITAASLSITGDSVVALSGVTPNAQNTFTVSSITTAGPMGNGVNVRVGANIAYYRLAGSTLSGGGTAAVNTVDIPVYGASGDPNFSAVKSGGASFSSAGTSDNVSVTGAYTAQTSVTVKSLRTSANITMLDSTQQIATDAIFGTGAITIGLTTPGKISTQTGKLYVNAAGFTSLTIPSSIVNNGGTATKLIISANNPITLTGTNTYSGGTVIQGGGNGVTLGSSSATPAPLASTSVLGSGAITGNGGSGLTLSTTSVSTFSLTNDIVLNDGGLVLSAPTGTSYTIGTGVISGAGDLFLTGAGTFTLNSASNTANGALRMQSSSTVTVNAAQAFTEYDFNNGSMTFRYGTGYTTDISSFITKRPGNTYRIDTNGQDITWASSVGNGSTYIKTGAGAHTLGAENFFASATVSTGTVQAGNVAALGYGNVTLSAGTTLQSLTAGGQNGKLTITGTLTNSAGGIIRIGG